MAIALTEWQVRGRRYQRRGDLHYGDPSWDILVRAFIASRSNESLSVTSIEQELGVKEGEAIPILDALKERGSLEYNSKKIALTQQATRAVVYILQRRRAAVLSLWCELKSDQAKAF